jgi:A/G-specific adenine glycosylase
MCCVDGTVSVLVNTEKNVGYQIMKKSDHDSKNDGERLIVRFNTIIRGKGITPEAVRIFRKIIYGHYAEIRRNLPWRKTRNPYRILVSEIMLQQTQIERVIEKYRLFIKSFPEFRSLAKAPLADVLKVWQGLGYNRRAIALKKISDIITKTYHNKLPNSQKELLKLPGIGPYSAAAITTFAFNQPAVFIETNIRRVFIHFFFPEKNAVPDTKLFSLVEKTLDRNDPRHWYYALMDYGVMLGKSVPNPNRRSAHYQRQSRFQGSNRQIRGMILQTLIKNDRITEHALMNALNTDNELVKKNLQQLEREGFLRKHGKRIHIA